MVDTNLVLNNKELVGRALDLIQTALQDEVISEMKFKYGLNWWYDGVVSKVRDLPIDAPRHPGVDDNDTREYLDIPRIYSLITTENLLPEGRWRDSKKLLYETKEVRNRRSHCGKRTYDASQARADIDRLLGLDEALDLDLKEELLEIREAVRDDTPTVPAPEPQRNSTPGIVLAEVPKGPLYDIKEICVRSSQGMFDLLEEVQEENNKVSRFTIDASYREKEGVFYLTLDGPFIVDDTTGVIVDGVVFGSGSVNFQDFDKENRTVTMYPGQDVRSMLEKDAARLLLFSDMKWLISRTRNFFEEYGDKIAYPPTPDTMWKDLFLSRRFDDMTADQKNAVEMCLSAPLSYVWGVPGSGKTQYVLATSINECIRRGERVVVIAPTNLALEQVLYGLIKAFNKDESNTIDLDKDVVRIGNPTSGFMRDYPSICENKRIQNELNLKSYRRNQLAAVMFERRYEELKETADAALRFSKDNPETEKTSEKLYGLLKPLISVMLEDPRFKVNARRLNTRTVYRSVGPIHALVYGREERSRLLEQNAGIDDDTLKERIGELTRDIDMLMASDPKADINKCKVIAMTLSKFILNYGPTESNGRSPLKVDHVFIDEAGYCNAAQIMSLFTLGVPITMLGDHKQLPPVCEIDRQDLVIMADCDEQHMYDCLWGMSALYADELFDDSPMTILESYKCDLDPSFRYTTVAELGRTHRFGQNLADVLGDCIYGRRIVSDAENDLDIEIIDAAIDSFPTDRNGKILRQNPKEARAVEKYIRKNDPQDYIVLTPYNFQVRCLKEKEGIPDDHVLTIHKSQGREWDTVIVSICDGSACDDDKPPRFTSTVYNGGTIGKRVINTALSRARKKLVIVCDEDYWAERDGELIGEIVKAVDRSR